MFLGNKTTQFMYLALLLMTVVECNCQLTSKEEKIELKASENVSESFHTKFDNN